MKDVGVRLIPIFLLQGCTKWFDSDDCSGNGDWETISEFSGISSSEIECPESYIIQGTTTLDNNTENNIILHNEAQALNITGNRMKFNYKSAQEGLSGAGLVCDNRGFTWANDGPIQECKNIQVRFCCPKNVTSKF